MSDKFEEALSALVARELPHARRDNERLAVMVQRLSKSLALVIAVASRGESGKASGLLDSIHNHIDESVAELLPLGRLLSPSSLIK